MSIFDLAEAALSGSTQLFTISVSEQGPAGPTGPAATIDLTGDVTSVGNATTINKTAITGKTLVTAAVGDSVLISDLSDSGNLKKVTVQTLVDLAGSGIPTVITVANESTNTTCFPAFFNAATGDLAPKTNTGLTFNSLTGAFGATLFVGPLTGNASTVTTNANLTGHVTSVGNAAVLGSFTKAQLDTAVSDDNLAYLGQSQTFVGNQAVTGNITASGTLALASYTSLSETLGGLATVLGNAIAASDTLTNQVIKTVSNVANYILMRYDRGISFHTNITGGTGVASADVSNEKMLLNLNGDLLVGTTLVLGSNGAVGGYVRGQLAGFAFPGSAALLPTDGSGGITDGTISFGTSAFRWGAAYLASLTTGNITASGTGTFAKLAATPVTFAGLPSASANTGLSVQVSDRDYAIATSNGTNWLRAGTSTVLT